MNNKQDKHTAAGSDSLISPRQSLLLEIAHKLKDARTEKQQNIAKAVSKLKISATHLQALESGNWDALPDDVYVIGFLRQYSKYLQVDLSDEIDRLKNSDYTLTRPLTFPDPPVAPSRLWAWLTGGAFVLLFVLFNVISSEDNQEDVVQSEPAHPTQNSTQTPTTEASNTSNHVAIKNSVRGSVKTASTTQTSTLPPHTKVANKNISTKDMTATPASKPAAVRQLDRITKPASVHSASKKQTTSMHLFRFEAVTAPVWMQIFLPNKAGDGKGRLLKEMLLKKGHFSNIRYATETLWITCGNALALRIKVDRKTIVRTGGLGSGKKVLRDHRFDIPK